jgi:hypothetical protein
MIASNKLTLIQLDEKKNDIKLIQPINYRRMKWGKKKNMKKSVLVNSSWHDKPVTRTIKV